MQAAREVRGFERATRHGEGRKERLRGKLRGRRDETENGADELYPSPTQDTKSRKNTYACPVCNNPVTPPLPSPPVIPRHAMPCHVERSKRHNHANVAVACSSGPHRSPGRAGAVYVCNVFFPTSWCSRV